MSGELHSDKKTRREVLQGVMALSANGFVSAKMAAQEVAGPMKAKMPRTNHVAVIGAGAFGGWTALNLLRRGTKVTLVDAWGPGNSRASSGGETRVIRGTYGANQPYSKMAARSMELWRENEKRWTRKLFFPIGVLWMAAEKDGPFERGSLPALKESGIPFEELSNNEIAARWPQINLEGVSWGIHEPHSGFLSARLACQAVLEAFLSEGGEYRQAEVLAQDLDGGKWNAVSVGGGSDLKADEYVFACGPWLGTLFPQTIGKRIRVTRQEIFFFGTPAGDERYTEKKMPVWGDHREHFMYGIPGYQWRGFKVADDTRGPEFNPTSGERVVSADSLKRVREYLGFRFPGLKDAPLIESRVCQYEESPDEDFIIDRHPARDDVWIVGGGSGHGFKHGPALGEMVAGLLIEGKDADRRFRLARFEKP